MYQSGSLVTLRCFFMYIFLKGGATALYIASQEGHLPALWLLMDTGAAIEAKDEVG